MGELIAIATKIHGNAETDGRWAMKGDSGRVDLKSCINNFVVEVEARK